MSIVHVCDVNYQLGLRIVHCRENVNVKLGSNDEAEHLFLPIA